MQKLIAKVTQTALTGTVVLAAIAIGAPSAKAASLIEKDLFFGRNISGGGQISEEQFQDFVDNVITERFPAGLTIVDADGQFLDSTGTLVREPSKLVTLFAEDTPDTETAINEIVLLYLQTFNQESVLQVTNEDELKVGFGAGENLIENDLVPEFIQTDLFFGRNIPTGGQVSEEQFQTFVDRSITPRFPAGLTIFDANGQFQDSASTIIEEPSKVVRLLLEDTVGNELALDEIIRDL